MRSNDKNKYFLQSYNYDKIKQEKSFQQYYDESKHEKLNSKQEIPNKQRYQRLYKFGLLAIASFQIDMDSNNIDYLVDLQGFKIPEESYIVKELAYVPVSGLADPHVLILPPYAWKILSDKNKREN